MIEEAYIAYIISLAGQALVKLGMLFIKLANMDKDKKLVDNKDDYF